MRTVKEILESIHGEGGRGFVSTSNSKPSLPQSIRVLSGALVRIHSEYTRLKDTDKFGRVRCFTCDKVMPWKESQEGHYIPRGKLPTKFENKNTHAQCPNCNMMLAGNLEVYRVRLDARYGKGTADDMLALSKVKYRPTRADYQSQIAFYKSAVKKAKKRLDI